MKSSNSIGKRDFSAKTNRALAQKGIAIVGITSILADEHDVYFSEKAYQLVDNGCSMIRRFREVLVMVE